MIPIGARYVTRNVVLVNLVDAAEGLITEKKPTAHEGILTMIPIRSIKRTSIIEYIEYVESVTTLVIAQVGQEAGLKGSPERRPTKLNKLKPCPRCAGKLYLDKDYNGPFISCRNCGFLKDLVAPDFIPEDPYAGRLWGTKDGCDLASRCLECPLPVCRYDDKELARVHYFRQRDDAIAACVNAKIPNHTWIKDAIMEASEELGITWRGIYRVLKRVHEREASPAPAVAHSPKPGRRRGNA